MDVVKTKVVNRLALWQQALLAVAVIIVLTVLYQQLKSNKVSVARSQIIVAQVQQGDLDVLVSGYGILKSHRQQLLSAKTAATVQEIVLKPGAIVAADSVIVRLDNPELQQQLDNAKQELAKLRANLRQLTLNNTREVLNETATFAQINAEYENAKLNLAAETTLMKQGVVSSLNYQRSILNEAQLKQRLEIAKQRAVQLKAVHQEAENIQLEWINQQQGLVNTAKRKLDSLTVRAGFAGVLQNLAVELGQSLAPGQEIALIGSTKELIALINVSQNQVDQVAVGQAVEVDTRLAKVMGQVTRINPVVINNTVEVEVSLPEQLPENARPQLNIDANILVASLTNVRYIERPANIKSNSQAQLYRIDAAQNKALLTDIEFGRQAGRFIEIKQGLELNSQLIISDLTNLAQTHPELDIY
ncbi:efflux RND transporter periplasmic adaptor subunit [Pseudoalteromonas tunicata]|jgi:multidrug resistance efflux pump|uniref:Efflux transporter, RND family, MFP subunit n=1 Tax=Pseudoalteromonas tunicata D2 TaxID=87626 RepID=A4CAI3_9GAMM|nr:HlyD family efflux transporter periplasmic adaptor subunit [Pseudoalteromonas tunicata]ATC94937.1 hypothetical protein PTUN_a2460 [Pseudoalteromonas tunicata]AXT30603.1 HlyD family efflux transporter periplasmic adaptor subunit [Pseudoalteromonas tunicata]EAR28391.1 efflux transporter, RND family, MFP subunit [Pseudoalteromonas tunicata D2]MDP5214144.1 HlyD family efflux transporter periplasmic adaptor subunit [Pseudoalteromonas tunicata]